jgi:hypothetical protein
MNPGVAQSLQELVGSFKDSPRAKLDSKLKVENA